MTAEPPASQHQDAICLVQLSDPHFFEDPQGTLLGMPTRAAFEAVLARAFQESRPDALILSGDLVHDGSRCAYQELGERLNATTLPWYCVPGNHDHWSLMRQLLGEAALGHPLDVRSIGGWQLVFLDSSRADHRDSGELAPEQLSALERVLAASSAPTLIVLHHHPSAIGSDWLDDMGVANGDDLMALARQQASVKAIVFGHIHQAFECHLDTFSLLGAPATSVQFQPNSPQFALDRRPPGYRELLLKPDGTLTTRIVRLESYPTEPCFDALGY